MEHRSVGDGQGGVPLRPGIALRWWMPFYVRFLELDRGATWGGHGAGAFCRDASALEVLERLDACLRRVDTVAQASPPLPRATVQLRAAGAVQRGDGEVRPAELSSCWLDATAVVRAAARMISKSTASRSKEAVHGGEEWRGSGRNATVGARPSPGLRPSPSRVAVRHTDQAGRPRVATMAAEAISPRARITLSFHVPTAAAQGLRRQSARARSQSEESIHRAPGRSSCGYLDGHEQQQDIAVSTDECGRHLMRRSSPDSWLIGRCARDRELLVINLASPTWCCPPPLRWRSSSR